MAAMTFCLGGLAVWMPSFFNRYWGMDVSRAGTLFGAVTVAGGLVGSLLGGWLGDQLLRVTGKAYFLVSGAGKREALRRVLAGEDLPAAWVAARRVVVVADSAAAP